MCEQGSETRTGIIAHFSILKDPRIERRKLHKLIDIIVIAVCAVIGGAENWEDRELYGEAKYEWFKTFLELPNGIPSHDTFARMFSLLNPEEFQKCFFSWTQAVREVSQGQLIAIDGKAIRHSFDTAAGKAAIHMVSAWATDNQLVLAQVKVDEKSNEITAVPKLLDMLNLNGCIVTMGCQKKAAAQIINQGGVFLRVFKKGRF